VHHETYHRERSSADKSGSAYGKYDKINGTLVEILDIRYRALSVLRPRDADYTK
jgi:hypothetical protein